MELVHHTLAPVFAPDSHTLILGTMPSPKSREAGFYYAHPQNRFWPVLCAVFDEPLPAGSSGRAALALRHGLALWDVLASCSITGASDASIRNPVPNEIGQLLAQSSIRRIFTTGAAATKLYRSLVEPQTGLPCVQLPSPSAANARMSFATLVQAYTVLRQ